MVDIDVVDAFEMREHRHARFRLDAGDQALAAARHDHVDAAVQSGQQQADRGAVAGRHQRDRGLRQIGFAQSLRQAIVDRAAGAETVGAAAQDHRVAGFQAQHAGVGGDIGAAFEDHGDDAERHAHALDDHAVRPLPALGDDADRIGNRAHGRDAVGHRIDARLRQRQPVDEGRSSRRRARLRDILGIGREDFMRMAADGALHRGKRVVLLLGRSQAPAPARRRVRVRQARSSEPASRRFHRSLSAARSCRVPASLRRCPSTEIAVLRRADGAWLGARSGEPPVGHWPSSGKSPHSAPPRGHRGGSFPPAR